MKTGEKDLGDPAGATENATVVGELLSDLVGRGLDFTQPRLYVLDGGMAPTATVKKRAGEAALTQRCHVHSRRNVLEHLTEEQKPGGDETAECRLSFGRLRRGKASAAGAAERSSSSSDT